MPNRSAITIAACLLSFALEAAAQEKKVACDPSFALMGRPGVTGDPRPLIGWRATAQPATARIEIESRVPEGALIQRIDNEASGNSFRPPQPLTNYRANVNVTVTSRCVPPDGSRTEPVRRARYYIDTGLACDPPIDFAEQRPGQLGWSAPSNATAFEVTTMAATQGRPNETIRTAATVLDIRSDGGGAVIAVGRSVCGSVLSAPTFAWISG